MSLHTQFPQLLAIGRVRFQFAFDLKQTIVPPWLEFPEISVNGKSVRVDADGERT
jgi:hypothetical protein